MAFLQDIDLDVFVGQDLGLAFVIYDDDATLETVAAGTATEEDISGWTIELVFRRRAHYDEVLFEDDATITDGPNGAGIVLVPAADATWHPGIVDFMIRRTGSGVNVPLIYGTINYRAAAAR